MITNGGATTTADDIDQLIIRAMTRLDEIAGRPPKDRPAHLVQLNAVLRLAVQQARQVQSNPASVGRDADLWRLRAPGYLRAICDHPVARPGNVLPLVPVLITWLALGAAELRYLRGRIADTANLPSFFADWMAQPWYLGPPALSGLIAISLLVIMTTYRRPNRALRIADETDTVVQRLEADLLPPLTVLHALLGAPTVQETAVRAAADLAHATQRLDAAADKLGASITVIDKLGAVVDRLVGVLPDLRDVAGQVARVETGLARSATDIADQLTPLSTMVADATGASTAARTVAERAADVINVAAGQANEARVLSAHAEEIRAGLADARRPFVEVSRAVDQTTTRLDAAAAALRETADRLNDTIREVNWLAMVSDGLRHADENHRPHRPVEPDPAT